MPDKRPITKLLIVLLVMPGLATAMDFVGSEACRSCHESEFTAWQGSHHQQALMEANEESVLGDFSNAEFTYAGITSRFFRRDGAFYVHTDSADGQMTDFRITHTFGVYPLQQYLVTFPDGRLQTLGIAWDSRPADQGGQRWFHVYPGGDIDHEDPLHWTGPQQNWNFMCADCHSTHLEKNYRPASDTFATTWSEISVGCEACHGPGSDHIAWASSDADERAAREDAGLTHRLNERDGVQWVIPTGGNTAQRSQANEQRTEVEVCATCHSRRGILSEGAAREAAFLDHYMPALLTEGLYYPDGQIRDEVYVWGSFIQSKMHARGVTCSDCHDPHTQALKLPGDAVCLQCHQASAFATTTHHHHPVESAGARCADCHMPETTYMVVDPRRDHSIRVPRPDLSLRHGTPNACTTCHSDQSTEWAATNFKAWYPAVKEPFQSWGDSFLAARAGDPTTGSRLAQIVFDEELPAIARATAVLELAPYLSQQTAPALQAALRDDSPLLRLAAARALSGLPPTQALPFAAHLLQDDYLAIRTEAGRLLAGAPATQMNAAGSQLLEQAISEYVATQELNADRSESLMNLGNLHTSLGQPARAEEYYRSALKRDAGFTPAWTNLADLYRGQGMNEAAVSTLRSGIQEVPESAVLHHALGLALIRSNQQDAALREIARAAELEPANARYAYVYGIALNSAGQAEAALDVLGSAHENHANNTDLLFALVTINRDRGDLAAARKWAAKLLEISPDNAQAQALSDSISGGD
jgi:predicted CXXCH cytochrome family protein